MMLQFKFLILVFHLQVTKLRCHLPLGTGNSWKYPWTEQTTENGGEPCKGSLLPHNYNSIAFTFLLSCWLFLVVSLSSVFSDKHDATGFTSEAETKYHSAQGGFVAGILVSPHVSFSLELWRACFAYIGRGVPIGGIRVLRKWPQ